MTLLFSSFNSDIWNVVIEYIRDALQNSEFAQGAVVAGVLTSIWQFFKSIYPLILSRIKRYFSYELVIENNESLYPYLNKWLYDNYSHKFKRVQIKHSGSDMQYEQYNDYAHIFIKGRILKMRKEREKIESGGFSNNAFLDRIVLGGAFCKGIISEIISLAEKEYHNGKDSPPLYRHYVNDDSFWDPSNIHYGKEFKHIFFKNKDELINTLDNFQNSKDWYIDRGLIWKLGILLYGPPGTGKTTIGKAIAIHTGRDLYTVNLASITDTQFNSLFSRIEKNAVLLLDDVDIDISGRDNHKLSDKVKLSTLLSCLDGSLSKDDLIVVMTTNRPEMLDEAMTRKGRVDMSMEISYPSKLDICNYISNFFNIIVLPEDITTNLKMPMVDVQHICLYSKNYKEVIDQINNLKNE